MVIAVGGIGVIKMLGFLDKPQTISETKVTVDLDKISNSGNKCPASWAYIGGGNCQRVVCKELHGNHPDLGGKGWKCGIGITGRWVLRFGEQVVRAVTDERCPLVEPEIGKNNSCQNGLTEKEIFAATDIRSGRI